MTKPKLTPYEKNIYQFLAILRFLGLAVGIGLTIMSAPDLLVEPYTYLNTYLILIMITAYTLLKVIYRFPAWSTGLATNIILWGDLVACISLVLGSGGLDSPFLIYSLIPILSTALLSQQKLALTFSGFSSLSLLVAHLGLSRLTPAFAWILSGNRLSLLATYGAVASLLALAAYRTNISVRRHLEEESALAARKRLRADLHDDLAQVLGYLQLKARGLTDSASRGNGVAADDIREIETLAESCYQDVRLALDMLATLPEGFALVPTLKGYIENWRHRSGIEVDFAPPRRPLTLHFQAQVELFYIAREALSNMQRHSEASRAWVELKDTAQGVSLLVRDNGRGFSPSATRGHGLSVMEERAQGIGGAFTISSEPGQGTVVEVIISPER